MKRSAMIPTLNETRKHEYRTFDFSYPFKSLDPGGSTKPSDESHTGDKTRNSYTFQALHKS